jgi:hypothetical protein
VGFEPRREVGEVDVALGAVEELLEAPAFEAAGEVEHVRIGVVIGMARRVVVSCGSSVALL